MNRSIKTYLPDNLAHQIYGPRQSYQPGYRKTYGCASQRTRPTAIVTPAPVVAPAQLSRAA